MQELTEKKKESLDFYLSSLIAEADGIPVEEVTVEYIRQKRDEESYSDIRYDTSSEYGGYDGTGLCFYTQRELEEKERSIDDFLKKATT